MFKKTPTGQSLLEWPLQNGSKCIFTCGRVLGKGGFGKCYQLLDKQSGNRFACKVIDKQSQQYKSTKQKVQSEISLQRKMEHPNIVRFEQYHEDENYIYILLQLCNNNTLDDVLHRRKLLNEIEVRYYFHQILEGVRYIHEQRVVHRDLKLENFFISEQMTIKIGDFGLASALTLQKRRKSICGTPNYMAPQIFSNKDGYSFEIDIWSLGVIAFLLLTGRFPFESSDINVITHHIKNRIYMNRTNLSENAKSFISKMLQPTPNERCTIKQLLKHDFFVMYEIPEVIPLSCLVCEPTKSFVKRYEGRKLEADKEDDDKFCFMLESKESPNNVSKQEIELTYKQIDSEVRDCPSLPLPAKKICSFGYESKQNDSCHIKKWIVEYWQHPRYGLLYKMSDGLLGLRFNDGSNLKIFDHLRTKFTYISTSGKILSFDLHDQISHPLQVKLKTFIRLISQMTIQQCCESGQVLYVRLFFCTLDIFLVWLNNGMLQGRYQNGSELIISIDSCMHIDAGKLKHIFPAKNVNEQSEDILKQRRIMEAVIKRVGKVQGIRVENKENLPVRKRVHGFAKDLQAV